MPKGQDGSTRVHRATYAKDKRKGGYIIRVAGPHANRFAGREVPVTLKNGDEQTEILVNLLWSGIDDDTKQPVALYEFKSRPAELDDEIPF